MLDSLLLTALGGVGIAGTLAATIWQGRSAKDAKREENVRWTRWHHGREDQRHRPCDERQ